MAIDTEVVQCCDNFKGKALLRASTQTMIEEISWSFSEGCGEGRIRKGCTGGAFVASPKQMTMRSHVTPR